MDSSLLIILLSCFTCCHVVGGVGGDSLATVMDKPHPCLDQERSALLEFKQGLTIERYFAGDYHKMDSWKGGGDCCASWDGVDCDPLTGHVIGLQLNWTIGSHAYISGSISGNCTLFQLFHLQKLNLSYNELKGQIPSSIFHLSTLSSLDVSYNTYDLRLHRPNLKDLVHNLTKLEHLHLDYVDMTGTTLHDSLSNQTCLKSLHLSNCGLSGEFPSSNGIYHLPNLRILDLSGNWGLSGNLPEFDGSNSLEELRIGSTYISGELPSSIGELSFLKVLDIRICNFSGSIPSFLTNLTNLQHIDLSSNQLSGQITSSLSSLTKLETLSLASNHFTGPIPSFLTNMTNLKHIDLSSNQFEGAIPNTFFNLCKLRSLHLQSNNLRGVVELDMFHKLGDLSVLKLSQNNLSLLVNEGTDSVVRDKYRILLLSSCNLSKFPAFLLNQSKLEWLDLSQNNMHGVLPTRIWNLSLSMIVLNISQTF